MTEPAVDILDYVITGDWLDAQEYDPVQFAVPGLIPEGFGLLTGPPKAGKSWAVMGLGLAVASGGKALGHINIPRPRPVLYMALEDGERRVQDRARKLLHGQPIPASIHFVTDVPPLLVLEVLDAWLEANHDEQPLVILDTLGRVMPSSRPGESAYERDYRIGTKLKRSTDSRPGSTLLVVHHVRKASGDDWMDSTSGTNGLNGSADFTVNLSRARNEETGLIRVTGRDVIEGEYSVTVNDGEWVLAGSSLDDAANAAQQGKATRNLGDDAAAIIRYATEHGPVSPQKIATALDLPANSVRQYLMRAVDTDRLTRISRGTYGPVTTVTTVTNGVSETGNVTDVTEVTPTLNLIPFERNYK